MTNKFNSDIQVSVVIPVYNDNENLIKAINSALNQIDVLIEVIVVDDCSTQDLQKAIANFINMENFTYIRNIKNLGVAMSRNIGVTNARGRYIAYLDSDDWWDCNKLIKQVSLANDYDADIVCTGRELAMDNGKLTGKIIHVRSVIDYKNLLKHNSVSCSSVLIKRELAKKYPMHCDMYHEDLINWLEITRDNYKIYGIDEPLLKYRLSTGGKSRNRLKSMYMTYKSYRESGVDRVKSIRSTGSHILNAINKYHG